MYDIENYYNAKFKLFERCRIKVINIDDNYGKQVKQFGYGDGVFSAISQREIEPGGTTSSQYTWTLHGFDNGRKFKVQLYSIHFTDGTEWTAENDQDVSIEGTINP